MNVTFQQIFEAAVARATADVWETLAHDQQLIAIYAEMRRLDAESIANRTISPSDPLVKMVAIPSPERVESYR